MQAFKRSLGVRASGNLDDELYKPWKPVLESMPLPHHTIALSTINPKTQQVLPRREPMCARSLRTRTFPRQAAVVVTLLFVTATVCYSYSLLQLLLLQFASIELLLHWRICGGGSISPAAYV